MMPILLLQKPHHKSKAKDHSRLLENRLRLWKEGNLNDLISEGRAIQGHLSVHHQFVKPNQRASKDLCNSLAMTARRVCTSYIDPAIVSPILACHLIALDKNSGVRPIGIGDTAR